MAASLLLSQPVRRLDDVTASVRALLPWWRRRAELWTALLDAELDAASLRANRLQLGFCAPALWGAIWSGWVHVDLERGQATRAAHGTFSRAQLDATPQLRASLVPLPLAELVDLEALLRAADACVPGAHRAAPLLLDFGLLHEAGGPRWRLQYEVHGQPVRIVHLDARTAEVLLDHPG